MKERWKPVNGWEGLYEISTRGRLWSVTTRTRLGLRGGVYRKPNDNGKGYLCVTLNRRGRSAHAYIHRLVAQAFVKNEKGLKEVNHKNGNKKDNRHSNLEWTTHSNNLKHAYITGLHCGAPKRFSPVIAYSYDQEFCFSSVAAAAERFGVSPCCISNAIHGRQKTCCGYHWRLR